MTEKLKFPLMFIFTVLLTFLYAYHYSALTFLIYISIITLSALFLVLGGELYSFLPVITFVISLAFINMYRAFINPSFQFQTDMIAEQLLGASMVIMWWLNMVLLYREGSRRRYLESILTQLEKIDPVSGVLTLNELLDELFYLTRRIERRDEPASLIVITLPTIKGKVPEKLLSAIGRIITSSIRIGYDIVGRENEKFFIILQGTGTDKAHIVINRIIQKLGKEHIIKGKELISKLNVKIRPLSYNYEANKTLILSETEMISSA